MIKRNIRSTPRTKINISAHLGSIKVGAEETLKGELEVGEIYECSPKLQSHKINGKIISRKVHSPKYFGRSELKQFRKSVKSRSSNITRFYGLWWNNILNPSTEGS